MKKGWQTKKLGDVCQIVMGTSPPGSTYNTVGDGLPLINGPVEFSPGSFGKTSVTKFTSAPNKLCKKDDLILCVRGSTTGRMNIADFEACIGRGVAALRAKDYQPWINWFIRYKRDEIYSLGTGATFPNISSAALASLAVPLAPLPEQRRIVGILDEAFDGIAVAKANAEKNLQNARALFDSHLNAVFSEMGAIHREKRLIDICDEITVGHVGSMAKKYLENGIPFLRSQNVRPFEISMENLVYIDEAFNKSLRKSQLRPGDVVVVRTGYPGTAAVIPTSLPVCNCSDLVIVRPRRDTDPHYLAVFFNSSLGKNLVAGRLVGAAQKHFNVTAAKQVTLAFPPISEQREVVAKIRKLGIETQRLQSIYQRKLARLDEFKKSLLDQAFRGEL